MAEREPRPLDRTSLSQEVERSRVIEDVLRDQARREVLRQSAYRVPRSSLRARVAAVALAMAALVAWIVPVPGLEPDIPFVISPEHEEAGLRLALYIQAQQVEAFRAVRGRLPDVLEEVGEPLPGMGYQRIDARTYRLEARTERAAVDHLSTDTTESLLGDSARRFGLGGVDR